MELLKELEDKKIGVEALEDLRILFEALEGSNCIDKIVFDLSLARGLDYYTGVIFEAVCKGAEVGSIGAGRRYDNLIGTVFTILEDLKKQQQNQEVRSRGTQVLICVIAENKLTEAAKLASPLWAANVKTEFLVSKRRTKHFDYAKKCGIPWMVIFEEGERKKGVVTLKKIVKDSEVEYKGVPIDSFDKKLSKLLTTGSAGFGWNQAKYVLVAFLLLIVMTIAE
ncbi:hypothetical protein AALP_AA5G253600 [Arabis alpina]|uniref:histidine--tRNA ligase n=1 Tax=Arabis alpina TaxID=50452 RepID=A0A087GZ99_ARAAL|nr:hypothetical protein AALP_AA5G253600 [Arabis alpina]